MVVSNKQKEVYEIESKHGAFYTGGQVQLINADNLLLCQCGGVVNAVDISQGSIVISLGSTEDESYVDNLTTFSLSSNNEYLLTSHSSGLFKLWKWKDKQVIKLWKSTHKGPVSCLKFNTTDELVASGGSDSSVRIWNIQKQCCLFSLKGSFGVISVVTFHPDQPLVFAAGDDSAIRCWRSDTGALKCILSGHMSKVTGITVAHDQNHIISCGRDKVIILWDIEKEQCVRTLPTFEVLESLVLLPEEFKLPPPACSVNSKASIATVGEKGIIRIWDLLTGKECYCQEQDMSLVAPANDGGLAAVAVLFNESKQALLVVSAEHNIVMHKLDDFTCLTQLVGFTDEILDIVYVGKENSHIAVATNSCDIKLYKLSDMSCRLLRGHTDLILSLAASHGVHSLLLSGAKDNTVRLWCMTEDGSMSCIGVGSRHTASVGAVAFSYNSAFFVSSSQDMCLKLWDIPKKWKAGNEEILNVRMTEVGHQKEINCICISPNDKLIASGSQDKTIKLWSVKDLSLVGTLYGHRRGIWCVQFSPVDQVLASSSVDTTVKLWSVTEFSCIKTFEGHDASVLKVNFLSDGMQILSAGGDGLLKLWNLKTSECIFTFEHNQGRVWALAVSDDESHVVTGSSDSQLIIWRDVTEEKKLQEAKKKEEVILQEQQLANYLHNNQMFAALDLALTLNRPLQVLRIVQDILKKGENGLGETIANLQTDQKEQLLKCASTWNCNSRNCQPAQVVMSILLDDILTGKLKPIGLQGVVEAALPYTERHFNRLTALLSDLHLLKYAESTISVVPSGSDSKTSSIQQ